MTNMKKVREIKTVISGMKASDGDGVQLTRLIGSPYLDMLDPFLLFDAFGSDQAQDYIGGFPAHPHRGFETVTYMLAGKMRHQDSVGNNGIILAGDVQWMTAGSGIIHSEMPEQTSGLLAGFQLWVNLPAKDKMNTPRYQEHAAKDIPIENNQDGQVIKVIAGATDNGTSGIIHNDTIEPIYWHVRLDKNVEFQQLLPANHNAFIYLLKGELTIGDNEKRLISTQLAVLTVGENLTLTASSDAEFLLIAGKPLRESVVRAGPFVMNTRAEINQAISDYQLGTFI